MITNRFRLLCSRELLFSENDNYIIFLIKIYCVIDFDIGIWYTYYDINRENKQHQMNKGNTAQRPPYGSAQNLLDLFES